MLDRTPPASEKEAEKGPGGGERELDGGRTGFACDEREDSENKEDKPEGERHKVLPVKSHDDQKRTPHGRGRQDRSGAFGSGDCLISVLSLAEGVKLDPARRTRMLLIGL